MKILITGGLGHIGSFILKNISKIKKIIQINLPAYMIPKKIFQITKIPFNKNGKIDRIFLKKKYQ